jgi:tRNA A58 N-methylase Trm61
MPDRRSVGLTEQAHIPPARLQQPAGGNEVSSRDGSPCRLARFRPIDVTGVMSKNAVSGPVSGKPTYEELSKVRQSH